jgi:hypothetical protein
VGDFLMHRQWLPFKVKKTMISSVVLLTLMASLILGSSPRVSHATPPPQEPSFQEGIVTPFQSAMQDAVNQRKADGEPVPNSVTYDTQVEGGPMLAQSMMTNPGQGRGASAATTTVTATTIIEFRNPQEAGYEDGWPALTLSGELPSGMSGELQTGDYTELYRERTAEQFPGIWDEYEFGQEPRKYTITETITIRYPDVSISSPGARALAPLTTSTNGDILMGFTYTGPDIDYHIEKKFEICAWIFGCFTVYDFWAGFELRWGAGLRLPTNVTMSGPAQMVQGDSYMYSAALDPSDWDADDYSEVGVEPEDGNEFIMEFVFRAGLRAVLFEVNLCPNCMVDVALEGSTSFETPFGPGASFPIPDISTEIYKIGFEDLYFAVIAGMRPHLGSTRITADWQSVSGGDCMGNGKVTFTDPEAPVEFGPVMACNIGPTDQAQVELTNFQYWFNQFLIEIFVGFEFNLFGFYHTTRTITVANLNLSSLTHSLYLGSHIQCNAIFECSPVGPSSVMLSSAVSDEDAPTTSIALAGNAPKNEWFISDVEASLTAVDNPPGCDVGVKGSEYDANDTGWLAYLGPFTLNTEGVNTVRYRSTDNEDNVEEPKLQLVKIDKTPPAITGAPLFPPNTYGWYHTDVVVHFDATDAVSGVDTITPDQTLSGEGAGQSVTGTATDVAGNSASFTVTGINIDKTPPVVTIIRPEGRTYDNIEVFNIQWVITDALSGVASEAGQLDGIDVSNGQLVELLLVPAGTHNVAAQGVDQADNMAGASVTFTVVTDIDGLLASLNHMCELGWISQQGVCKSLNAKLAATKAAIERDQLTPASNTLNAFINELEAQRGKAVSQTAFDVLLANAIYVMEHFILVDACPADPNKVDPGICGCGTPDVDSDGDGTYDCLDNCPVDVSKTEPGLCGCGIPDTDGDGDSTPNCVDQCPADPAKTGPGACGCGIPDTDGDGDGTPNCVDQCATDPAKTEPGACGCGIPDTDSDGDGTPNCFDQCATDPAKTDPGVCGCGVPDADSDNDTIPDCQDSCPYDATKVLPGVCGCGVPDADSDNDTIPDCQDSCPYDAAKVLPGVCGCGVPDTDSDHDTIPDCADQCPDDPSKVMPGICGCGLSDEDTDNDGWADCVDECSLDPNKHEAGICGCGVPDTDSDHDGIPDCIDQCPDDPGKVEPGECGCGTAEGTCD